MPVSDPEHSLFHTMQWVLVKTGEELGAFRAWSHESSVAVICVEAVRERPSMLGWHHAAARVFFVSTEQPGVAGIPSGAVDGNARYILRDLAAALK